MLIQRFKLNNRYIESGQLKAPANLSILDIAKIVVQDNLRVLDGKNNTTDIKNYMPFLPADCTVLAQTKTYINQNDETASGVQKDAQGIIIWQSLEHLDTRLFKDALSKLLQIEKMFPMHLESMCALMETLEPGNIELANQLMDGFIETYYYQAM